MKIKNLLDNLDLESMFALWGHARKRSSRLNILKINLRLFVKVIFFRIKFCKDDQYADRPSIIYSHERSDYTKHLNVISKGAKLNITKIKNAFSLKHNLKNIFIIMQFSMKNNLDINESLNLYFLIKNYRYFLKYAKSENILISFSETQIYENFLVQVSKMINKYTIGLQHGFFADDYDEDTLNSVNYTNIQTDEILVWGESTKKLVEKYNPNVKSSIVGRSSSHFLSASTGCSKKLKTSIVAILDGPEFDISNRKILKLVKEISKNRDLNFFIRPHPADLVKENLDKIDDKNISDIGSFPLFIGSRSSLLIELAVDGYECYAVKGSPFFNNESLMDYSEIDKDISNKYIAFSSPKTEKMIFSIIENHL